jgi:hypothetical protein
MDTLRKNINVRRNLTDEEGNFSKRNRQLGLVGLYCQRRRQLAMPSGAFKLWALRLLLR